MTVSTKSFCTDIRCITVTLQSAESQQLRPGLRKEVVITSLRRCIRLVTVRIRETGRATPEITNFGCDTAASAVFTCHRALGLVGIERLKNGGDIKSVQVPPIPHMDHIPPPTTGYTPFLQSMGIVSTRAMRGSGATHVLRRDATTSRLEGHWHPTQCFSHMLHACCIRART